MKRVIDTSEILGTVDLPNGVCELCAEADADHDEAGNRLTVQLRSFLRTTNLRVKEKHLNASWLPKPEIVTELVGSDEALPVARDVFHRWVRKVRDSAPSLHND